MAHPTTSSGTVGWDEVREALAGWRDLEAFLPVSCLTTPLKSCAETQHAASDAMVQVGSSFHVQHKASEDNQHAFPLSLEKPSIFQQHSQVNKEANEDLTISCVSNQSPSGSLEGIAFLRRTLPHFLLGCGFAWKLQQRQDILATAAGMLPSEWALVFEPTDQKQGRWSMWDNLPYTMESPVKLPPPLIMLEFMRVVCSQYLAAFIIGAVFTFYTVNDLPTIRTSSECLIPSVELYSLLADAFQIAALHCTHSDVFMDFIKMLVHRAQSSLTCIPITSGGVSCTHSQQVRASKMCAIWASEMRLLYLAGTGVDPHRHSR
mmetsp:Transcript_27120/g.51643  ORF Transcript_27120/g.51643 Transcript_27120/m.51643 type:complete len:319 (+) Transcript_27120:406-1362(+)